MLGIVAVAVWFVWKVENILHQEAALGPGQDVQGIVSPMFGAGGSRFVPIRTGATAPLAQRSLRSLRHKSDPLPGVSPKDSAPQPARRQRSGVMAVPGARVEVDEAKNSIQSVRSQRRNSHPLPGNPQDYAAQYVRQQSSSASATKPPRKLLSTKAPADTDMQRRKEAGSSTQHVRPHRTFAQDSRETELREMSRAAEEYVRDTKPQEKTALEAEIQQKARRARLSKMEELAQLQVSNSFHALMKSQSFSELADKTCEQLSLSRYDLWHKKALWNSLKVTWASMQSKAQLPKIASRPRAQMPSPPSKIVLDSPAVEDCESPAIALRKHEANVAMHKGSSSDDMHQAPAFVDMRPAQELRDLMTQHLLARMRGLGGAVVLVTHRGGGHKVLQKSCAQPTQAQSAFVKETAGSDGEEEHSLRIISSASCYIQQEVSVVTTEAFKRLTTSKRTNTESSRP